MTICYCPERPPCYAEVLRFDEWQFGYDGPAETPTVSHDAARRERAAEETVAPTIEPA